MVHRKGRPFPSATTILPPLTTIITARGTVGRLACLARPMAMNQTCYGIRGASGYPGCFVYWLRRTVQELRSRTHGTIFDTITRQTFTLVDWVRPPMEIRTAFESIVAPIMERILSNLHQNSSIAALRDTLLPKLVSGKLRVNVHATRFAGYARPVSDGANDARYMGEATLTRPHPSPPMTRKKLN